MFENGVKVEDAVKVRFGNASLVLFISLGYRNLRCGFVVELVGRFLGRLKRRQLGRKDQGFS